VNRECTLAGVIAATLFAAGCGSEVETGAGAGAAGGQGGRGGAPPEPADSCDAFDESTDPAPPEIFWEPCCSQPGCVWIGKIGQGTTYELGCVSEERLCYFGRCGETPTVDEPCPNGYVCVTEPSDGAPHECTFIEQCARRGYCVWLP
jgi:hypothetical protein